MKTKIFLSLLLLLGFFFRIYGLRDNSSFWTDEGHVAIFVRVILERGRPILASGDSTGAYQWLQYWISAASARFFGLNEFAIRFPSVVFGALTIWAIYLLGKTMFNERTGIIAATLIAFLKIEILWSRQARPYQALQFFYLLGAYFLFRLARKDEFNYRYFLGFLISGVLATIMHSLGFGIFLYGFFYLIICHFSWVKKRLVKLGPFSFLALGSVLIFWWGIRDFLNNYGESNNLFYYRVFLWHNYPLLVFLALVGMLSQIFKKRESWRILVVFLTIHFLVISFFIPQPFTRYFYIVFPYLILFAAAGLVDIASAISLKRTTIALAMMTIFIVFMGNKFVFKLQKTYSLNEDMQELPEVDWKKIYSLVGEKLASNPDSILIANWNDTPVWFLGEGRLDYFLRESDSTVKKKDGLSLATLVYSLDEFKRIVVDNRRGILVIDSWDNLVPDGVREYARDNLKKELEIDRVYPTQPRYWPVLVYSWGLKD